MNSFFSFDRLLTALLFLAITLAAFLMPAQGDTWWQLRAGQEMWLTKHILLHDTFSHTVSGTYWPNHEWLSQVLFYGVYATGGMPLLTIVSATAVLGTWSLVWRLTPGSTRSKFLLTSFVIASASTTWSPRPQVLSLLLLVLTMTLLCTRRYVWLPITFLLWANLHGAVVMGLLLLGAALVATVVENRKSFPSRTRLRVLPPGNVGDAARPDLLDRNTTVSRPHSTARYPGMGSSAFDELAVDPVLDRRGRPGEPRGRALAPVVSKR